MGESITTKTIRVLAYVVGAVLMYASAVLAANDDPVQVGGLDIVKWSITQGGLVVALLVILWSYRRDFTRVLVQQRAEIGLMSDLVKESSVAMTECAAAVREQTMVIREWRTHDRRRS